MVWIIPVANAFLQYLSLHLPIGNSCTLRVLFERQVGAPPPEIYEFYHLGLGDFYTISSAHGLGIGEVLDAILQYLPQNTEDDGESNLIKAAGARSGCAPARRSAPCAVPAGDFLGQLPAARQPRTPVVSRGRGAATPE